MQLQEKLQKRLPLIIAIACGILAILLLNVYLRRRESEIWEKIKQAQQEVQQAKPPVKMGVVLVAKRDIPPQIPISPEDLSIKEMPVEYIQPGAVTSLARVIGKIASGPITAGEQIVRTRLLAPGRISKSLSEVTPEGKRAITVLIDAISTIAGLRPGDYIDVFALISPPSGVTWPESEKAASRLVALFQGVKVLAVGGEFVAPLGVSPAAERERARRPSPGAETVTLALSPQESVLLSFVQEHGKIKLVLRSSEDVEVEPVKSVDWDTLFQYLYPTEEKKPALEGEQPTVEIYRGLKREIVPLSEGEK